MKHRVIVFLGTVGSGKSTQMRLLASYMRGRGFRVRVAFLKTGHLLAYVLEVFLARLLVGRRGVRPLRALIEGRPWIARRLFRLWASLDAVSISMKFLFSVYIPVRLGFVVLVEEYIPAIVADYVYLSRVLGVPLRALSSLLGLVLRLFRLGGPIGVVFLDADNRVLELRWRRRGSPTERLDYLKMQRTILRRLAEAMSEGRFVYIDTAGRSVRETHEEIVRLAWGWVKGSRV